MSQSPSPSSSTRSLALDATSESPWLHWVCPRPSADTRLFTFPYAGAGPSIFRTWHEYLPSGVDVCAVQLPGREARIIERPFQELAPLVHAVADGLRLHMDRPFAFFGHSFGAVLAFALAEHLHAVDGPSPSVLMLSGRPAPAVDSRLPPLHPLPPTQFLVMVSERYRAIPPELLQEPEILALVLPALRADISLAERHHHEARGVQLPIPIVAFGGKQDQLVRSDELERWSENTTREFIVEMFEGDHFYLNHPNEKGKLLSSIGRILSRFAT